MQTALPRTIYSYLLGPIDQHTNSKQEILMVGRKIVMGFMKMIKITMIL